jgi:hypothetical protein
MARAFESRANIDEDHVLFPLKAMVAPMAWPQNTTLGQRQSAEAGPRRRHGKDVALKEGQARRRGRVLEAKPKKERDMP